MEEKRLRRRRRRLEVNITGIEGGCEFWQQNNWSVRTTSIILLFTL